MRPERGKSRHSKISNPTLEGVAPEELMDSVPAAERWIIKEIRKMQRYDREADIYRRKAMAGIAERFHQRVYRYCLTKLSSNREEAEDVVQDVFQDLEKILGRVVDEEHLRKLIFRLAKNKCADVNARLRRVATVHEIRPITPAFQDSEPDDLASERLREAIKSLPKLEDRILLTLSLDYRMPIKQIANVLEISEGACKMRRHRARRKLKSLLEEE